MLRAAQYVLGLCVVCAVAATAAYGQGRPKRLGVWDIPLNTPAAELPNDAFIEFACGTNGGPPSRPIKDFTEFARCPADANGLHEVYFRYDDELEYVARALEQEKEIQIYRGTQAYDYPIIASLLFNDQGIDKGMRIVTDPRDTAIRDRNEFWTMGNFLKQRFGSDGWDCKDLPAAEGENPVGSYFIKNHCEKIDKGLHLIVEQQYLQKKGQTFINPANGQIEPNAFDSWTRFEMYSDDVQLQVAQGRVSPGEPAAPVTHGTPRPSQQPATPPNGAPPMQ
jgi:hypothetical protein